MFGSGFANQKSHVFVTQKILVLLVNFIEDLWYRKRPCISRTPNLEDPVLKRKKNISRQQTFKF